MIIKPASSNVWKWILFAIGVVIVGSTLWYANFLVNKIESEEQKKLALWAKAIREKAKIVKVTNELFLQIQDEERKKGQLWANGVRRLINITDPNADIGFIFEVVKNNETVPVILTDADGRIISHRNIDPTIANDSTLLRKELEWMKKQYPAIEIDILNKTKNYLYYKDSKIFTGLRNVLDDLVNSFMQEVVINSASVPVIYTDNTQKKILAHGNLSKKDSVSMMRTLKSMKLENQPIPVELGNGIVNYIFYRQSYVLTQLRYFPLLQLSLIAVFAVVAYALFNTDRRSEQNLLWVGMSKETAHQLGTPLSSLMAWIEIKKADGEEDPILQEIEKDVDRLNTITERFSKIGSIPKLEPRPIYEVLEHAVSYLKPRISNKIEFTISSTVSHEASALLNVPLFEWVIENLVKNAADAMSGQGKITFSVLSTTDKLIVEVADTGSGIPKSKQKTIFKPGYTTKVRGWGLGLSLVKRIIEQYHHGKIYVKHSDPNTGTIFRIELKK